MNGRIVLGQGLRCTSYRLKDVAPPQGAEYVFLCIPRVTPRANMSSPFRGNYGRDYLSRAYLALCLLCPLCFSCNTINSIWYIRKHM